MAFWNPGRDRQNVTCAGITQRQAWANLTRFRIDRLDKIDKAAVWDEDAGQSYSDPDEEEQE
jgi:hypothetical protein